MAKRKTAKGKSGRQRASAQTAHTQKTDAKKTAKQTWKPQKPRRWTPMQAQRIIGRMLVPAILLAALAAAVRQPWPLVPALILWAVMALILFKYWRCPECGKTLPKTGKTFECPRCGAKID